MQTTLDKSAQKRSHSVWADDTNYLLRHVPESRANIYLVIAIAVTIVTIAGSFIMSVSVGEEFTRALLNSETRGAGIPLQAAARLLAIKTALVGAGGAFILCMLSVAFSRHLKREMENQIKTANSELVVKSQRLIGQMTEAKFSVEENKRELFELRGQLEQLTRRNSSLENELNEKRAAEKSLAQQAVKLERSKDVLEMHVHARTQQMQKLQRRNELILNAAVDGICGFDLQGKATFVNPAVARLTGWKSEELLGKTEEEIFFPIKDSVKKQNPWNWEADGKPSTEQNFWRKDGATFSAEYVKTPIRENDQVVGSVVMFRDITERILAENKLNQKAEELARSNKELEQFAFVASHDLQEPLRKIQAFGDRLKSKCSNVLVAEGKDYLERMQSAAARMQTLINDLLTFSRVISSSQPFVPVDLSAVTRDVLVDLEHRIEKSGGKVIVGNLPKIEGDPTQMRQLLQNLIGNALKFKKMNVNPVVNVTCKVITRCEIEAPLPLPKASPNCLPDDLICQLSIEDNGIGFDEQYLEKIFAVFQRLHGREEYEGTGVGLAVCRRITERHRGTITARGKLGEGSTFIVLLPLKQPEPTKPA